ncbi:MAG: CBS domain-containing protein [Desulfobacterales bacterium]|nr:CBS domain-containing protein [Desulfobacterales bacterium]
MTLLARDIMVKDFDKIHSGAPASEAVEMILNGKVRATGHKTISLVVVDGAREMAGVVTMFDILYHLRPSFLNRGISGEDIDWHGQMLTLVKELKAKKVKEIMSTQVVWASADEHLMVLLDRMVKNRYRRLPVLENQKPIGIVYISDIYHHLFTKINDLQKA